MMSMNELAAVLRGAGRGGRSGGAGRGDGAPARGAFRTRPDPVRAVAAVALAAWLTSYLRNDRYWSLLDDVDLAIHETGHVVFSPFGEFMGVAGGSLFQVLVPLAFVLYFAWRRDAFASFLVLFWVSQSLFNVAVYVADARAQALPLVGGEYAIHDWSWMLSRLHVLTKDESIAAAVRALASSLWIAAALGALVFARKRVPIDTPQAP
jgi:hypothetical protein